MKFLRTLLLALTALLLSCELPMLRGLNNPWDPQSPESYLKDNLTPVVNDPFNEDRQTFPAPEHPLVTERTYVNSAHFTLSRSTRYNSFGDLTVSYDRGAFLNLGDVWNAVVRPFSSPLDLANGRVQLRVVFPRYWQEAGGTDLLLWARDDLGTQVHLGQWPVKDLATGLLRTLTVNDLPEGAALERLTSLALTLGYGPGAWERLPLRPEWALVALDWRSPWELDRELAPPRFFSTPDYGLRIETASAGAFLRVTLNGTDPTDATPAEPSPYELTLPLEAGPVTVKARVDRNDRPSTEIVTRVFAGAVYSLAADQAVQYNRTPASAVPLEVFWAGPESGWTLGNEDTRMQRSADGRWWVLRLAVTPNQEQRFKFQYRFVQGGPVVWQDHMIDLGSVYLPWAQGYDPTNGDVLWTPANRPAAKPQLTWNAADGSVTVTGAPAQQVYWHEAGASGTPQVPPQVNPADLPQTAYPGAITTFTLVASGSGLNPSEPLRLTIDPSDETPPGPVSSLSAQPGPEQVTLTWVNPSDLDFEGIDLRWWPVSDATQVSTRSLGRTETTALIEGLNPGVDILFNLQTRDALGNLSPAVGVTASAQEPDLPPLPVSSFGIALVDGDATRVELNWTWPVDDTVQGVQISVTPALSGFPLTRGTGEGTQYLAQGLTSGTPYTFTLRTYDGANLFSEPRSASVTTGTSGTGTVTVDPDLPPALYLSWSNYDGVLSPSETLSAGVLHDGLPANGEYTYAWFHDGVLIPGAESQIFQMSHGTWPPGPHTLTVRVSYTVNGQTAVRTLDWPLVVE